MTTLIMIGDDSSGGRNHKDELSSRHVKEVGSLGLGDRLAGVVSE